MTARRRLFSGQEAPPICRARAPRSPCEKGAGGSSPPHRTVKRELGAKAKPKGWAGGIVGLKDVLLPAVVDAILGAILAVAEEEQELQHRRRGEEINIVLYDQGLAKTLTFNEKEDEWHCEKIE